MVESCDTLFNIIVWGIGVFYHKYLETILIYEKELNQINTICCTDSNTTQLTKMPDDTLLVPKQIAFTQDFDFVIIASQAFESEIFNELKDTFKIPTQKIIYGSLFKDYTIHLNTYLKFRSLNYSIITESCYGGFFYHRLKMQFNTPFINMRISSEDYFKLLSCPLKYLNSSIQVYSNQNLKETSHYISWELSNYPMLMLDNEILFHCTHSRNSAFAINQWNRRIARINYNNLLFIMIIENKKDADRFSQIKGINKLGLYYKPHPCHDIIYLDSYNEETAYMYNHSFRQFVHNQISNGCSIINTILKKAIEKNESQQL